jgi:hypothetical protein
VPYHIYSIQFSGSRLDICLKTDMDTVHAFPYSKLHKEFIMTGSEISDSDSGGYDNFSVL